MRFSEQFETRFAEMLTHYPTKRSALVPTLLYAQDEVGSLSDEVSEELLEHCEKKLGIGHKGTTPDGLFSLEEVECIGACSWAPAAQVNYDFHENLTNAKMDQILDEYKNKLKQ